MTKTELELLNNITKGDEMLIGILDLGPFTKDRTLIYGYTCNRETFHVYVQDRQIHTVIYNTDYSQDTPRPKDMREITIKHNRDYVPDKRLYPERCDYRFCKMLERKDISLPFTAWTDDVEQKDFYGFTLEDCQ